MSTTANKNLTSVFEKEMPLDANVSAKMLREAKHVTQYKGEPMRRWFMSPYFDLIVWFSENEEIIGFELCYGKPDSERAFCWSEGVGYKHHKVDDGESEPMEYKMTPIYVPDGAFDKESVLERFKQEACNVEQSIREYVVERISEFSL